MWEEGWWVIQDVAVTPCEGRVSRNGYGAVGDGQPFVTPCEGRVSRNPDQHSIAFAWDVTPREGRVSRNQISSRLEIGLHFVTPREGRVSRNIKAGICTKTELGHAP